MIGSRLSSRPHISIVSPVYRAESCVAELCQRLIRAVGTLTDNFEIILVEDRSPDKSWNAIQVEAQKDTRIKGIRLARNFGQHRAITAGLDMAQGDWVLVMDCDLQDPPEDIPKLYAKALEGHEIVVAQFEERTEKGLKQATSRAFWRILSWLAGIPFDHRIGNFRIMSRRVVENFRQYREQLRLLGGLTSLMGFTTATLPLKRAERFAGQTSYSFGKLLAIAIDIAMAYSDKPLRLSVIAGLLISGLSIVVGLLIIVLWVMDIIDVEGWASVMISIYFTGGLIIANLGVIGIYVGKTFDETKRRPLYVIESETANIAPVSNHDTPPATEGRVIWITGLSGAGKSTLARLVVDSLQQSGHAVVLLDGDALREVFGASGETRDYDRAARVALALRYAHLCHALASQGLIVVIATISLFREVHVWNRENLPGYFEAYLRVPVEELRRRDPKGIYRRFDAGELSQVAGLDMPIDEPEKADWIAEFNPQRDAATLANELLLKLNKGTLDGKFEGR